MVGTGQKSGKLNVSTITSPRLRIHMRGSDSIASDVIRQPNESTRLLTQTTSRTFPAIRILIMSICRGRQCVGAEIPRLRAHQLATKRQARGGVRVRALNRSG